MSLTDMGNVTGKADFVDESNELNLGTVEFMVPAGHQLQMHSMHLKM